jgi:hypothetical protein
MTVGLNEITAGELEGIEDGTKECRLEDQLI